MFEGNITIEKKLVDTKPWYGASVENNSLDFPHHCWDTGLRERKSPKCHTAFIIILQNLNFKRQQPNCVLASIIELLDPKPWMLKSIDA